MLLARKIGLCLIAAAAVAVVVVFKPSASEASAAEVFQADLTLPELRGADYTGLLQLAMSDFDANETRADSAPQQQVVAGWAMKDLLSIQVMENDEINANLKWLIIAGNDQVNGLEALSRQMRAVQTQTADQRLPILGALALVAAAWWALTEPRHGAPMASQRAPRPMMEEGPLTPQG